MQFSTGRTFAFFPGHTRKPSFHHLWLPRSWSWDRFGLANGGQCKLTRDRPSAPPSGDGAQISLTHVSFAIIQLESSGTYRMLFQHPLQPLWCRSARMISRTRATVSSVWEVDGQNGRGSSSKDRRPLLKREYQSNVFDRPRQDSTF